jgi:class 3 adenylate cyclase
MFAAAHPDRTLALILYGTDAKGSVSPDYLLPGAWSQEAAADFMARLQAGWGTLEYARESLAEYDPSLRGDEEMAKWYASFQRLAASPGAAEAIERLYLAIDVRAILPTIGVPTLVVHRTGDPIEPVAAGRYIADNVPGARFVELEGIDHHPWAGDADAVADEVERFLVEVRGEEAALDRVLATVLFTDIVDSTAKAATLGDGGWRAVRERHDQIVRAQLTRYRGREVKTMGDGFLATFDGPARGVRCAMSIVDTVRSQGIEVRAGLHTGELELGPDDVSGIAVAIGARVGALALPSQVLVSSTVKDLVVGSGLSFEDAGEHELKGVPDRWRLYHVVR